MKMSERRLSIIDNALLVAAAQFDTYVEQFEALAKHLREGGVHALFAAGEGGARAADRMADQFRRQAKDARDLHTAIQDEDESDEE